MAPSGSVLTQAPEFSVALLNPGCFPSSSLHKLSQASQLDERNYTPGSALGITGQEVGRKEGPGLYTPCQPISVPLSFRSASRPIRARQCNLRLHSALFAVAGSVGAAARETLSFFYFFPRVFTSGSGADPDARGRRMFDLRISEALLCIHSRLHRWRQQRRGRRLSSHRRR